MSGSPLPRLAFVYEQRFPDTIGGAERYYAGLTTRLAREQRVTYISRRFQGRGRRESAGGVRFVGLTRARPRESRSFLVRNASKAAFALAVGGHLLLRGRSYDVVHVACFPHAVALAARAGLAPHRGCRLVVDWHEVHSEADWRSRLGRKARLGRAVQRLAARTGDAAVAFSSLHAGRLRSEGRREDAVVLPEFVPEPLRQHAGESSERERLVVFAARLVAQKRGHLVPPALRLLREADPRWRAVVFGDGPERDRIEAAAGAEGVADAVELPGFAAWDELSRVFERSACLLMPTTREGFGLVVLEAAAHGVPVVLVAEPDNAAVELIEEGVNGHVCSSADPAELAEAVRSLTSDPGIHARTRAWFERASERYSLDAAAAEARALHALLLSR